MKIPDQVLNQHIAVLGKTRGGKTNTAKLCIEQIVAAGSRVCVLDPIKSDYWGLTSSSDGKKPGLPFRIVGGKHGHAPLHSKAGSALAEVVASGKLRLSIIDMEEFGPRESGPFFADFMATIFRKIEGVLYLVIDEAHLFAPKEGRGGDESMATYWFKRMASGSGSKGVRLIVSTQRVQELHNTVLSNCDTVIAHRVTFPEDQKRISDWVASHATKDQVAEVKRSLPNLQRGEAWICAGEAGIFERRQLPLCATYDNSRTPTESDKRLEVKTAQIDQDELRSIIGDAVKEAEANDPKLLRQQLAELQKQLTAQNYREKPRAADSPEGLERARQAGFSEGMRQSADAIRQRNKAIETLRSRIQRGVDALRIEDLAEIDTKFALPQQAKTPVLPSVSKQIPERRTDYVRNNAPPAEGLNKLQQKIIDAIAWYESMGVMEPSTAQVGAVALVDPSGGYFSNTVGPLASGGLVERSPGTIRLTDAGRALAKPIENVGTLDEYHNTLRDRVRKMKSAGGKTIEMLDAIIAAGGESLTTEQIGKTVGVDHTGGYFSNMIGPLSTVGLIRRERGAVTPTEILFPEALA